MKNLKAPLIILVVIGLFYGGAKGYVYFQAKNKMDEMVNQAQLFAEVTYEGIETDLLKGRVAVNNIMITPVTLQDSVTIRQISLQGDGPMFLFSDAAKLQQQTPEMMQLNIRSINASLNGQLFASVNTMAAASGKQTKSCALGGAMTPEDLGKIGIEELNADVNILISRPKLSTKTSMEMDLMMDGIADMNMSATIRGGENPMAIAMAPQLDEIRFTYSVDSGYMSKMKKFCAAQMAMSEADYIDSIANASDEDYIQFYGFAPGEEIRQAIGEFMLSPKSVELVMVPSPDINPVTLSQYRPEDVIEMLGIQLTVNGKVVKDLSFKVGDELSALFGEQSVKKADDEEEQTEVTKSMVSYTYQSTPMERLPQYIGAQLKIKLSDGLEREGALLSVNTNDLQLEQRLHGGKFQVYVPKDKIVDVKVLRLLKE